MGNRLARLLDGGDAFVVGERSRSIPTDKSPLETPSLLRLPVEIRLLILRHLVCADPWRFCPHNRLSLKVSIPVLEHPKLYEAPPATFFSNCDFWYTNPELPRPAYPQWTACQIANGLDLRVLQVSQKLHREAIELLYTENIFYLEQYFSLPLKYTPFTRSKKPILPFNLENIPRKNLHLVRKVGFSVIDRSRFEPDFRTWEVFCSWAKEKLPNLQQTYIFLFGPGHPSQRFLVRLVRFLDSIPGQKTIVYRASNNCKRMVGNILAEVFRHRTPDAPTIRILGGCYCQCWTPPFHTTSRHRRGRGWTGPDTLYPWVECMHAYKHSNRWGNAIKGSITPRFSLKHKGPIVGCLLCHKPTECVHDKRLKPGRIGPNADVETAASFLW